MGAPRPTPHKLGNETVQKELMTNCNHPACHPIHALRPLYNCLKCRGKVNAKKSVPSSIFYRHFTGSNLSERKCQEKEGIALAAMSCLVPIFRWHVPIFYYYYCKVVQSSKRYPLRRDFDLVVYRAKGK